MSLFSAIVKTAINTALLPVAIAKDVVTLGNTGEEKTSTEKQLEQLKKDSEG